MRVSSTRIPGLQLTDHYFRVPVNHARPGVDELTLFAREVVAPRRREQDLPWLLYLQGGPGHRSPRPASRSGWLTRALLTHRVLLLDQRGTGLSSPVTRQTVTQLGSPAAQASYLANFRADSIVRDAELVRRALIGPDHCWSVLGDSFGGFCSLTYLSIAPEGVREVLITGGLPPMAYGPDEVYRATYTRVLDRTSRYLERYPADGELLDAIADLVAKEDVRLPSGDGFPVERLQQLGVLLGRHDGFERMHFLLETAFVPDAGRLELSDEFLAAVERETSFVASPLHAILQESIYCAGAFAGPSSWSAHRLRAQLPELAPQHRPLRLTGEMIYPWMFDVDRSLMPFRGAAELLAQRTDWPPLYDTAALADNQVPIAAAIYHDDMYVDYGLSMQTARVIGNLRYWVTNEYGHDGLHGDARVLDRLFDLAAGEA